MNSEHEAEVKRLLQDSNRLQLHIVRRVTDVEARLVKAERYIKRHKMWWRVLQIIGAVMVFIITFNFGDIAKMWR